MPLNAPSRTREKACCGGAERALVMVRPDRGGSGGGSRLAPTHPHEAEAQTVRHIAIAICAGVMAFLFGLVMAPLIAVLF
jgi:hypothetical protein